MGTDEELAALRQQLRKAEARLAEAQRIAQIGYWEHDFTSNRGWWSDELCRIYGAPTGHRDLTFESFMELVHPEDRDAVRESIHRSMRQRGSCEVQFRIVLPDGSQRVLSTRGEFEIDPAGNPISGGGTVQDITARKEDELRRAESERRQRDALVREVHHRIKNSLQGVAALLERHMAGRPELQPVIRDAVNQLNTLALMHGLHSELGSREVNLCNITRGIVDLLRPLSPAPLEFKLQDGMIPVELAQDERVPIALILNELVSNAIKYTDIAAAQRAITIEVTRTAGSATVLVRNQRARLPEGFDMDSGACLGTGLKLARLLLPARGATLSVREVAADAVEAVLRLSPPVLEVPRRAGAIDAVP